MPPKRLEKGKNLSEEQKYRIVFLSEQHISIRKIATMLNINKNTVSNTLKKWKFTGSVAQLSGQGRKKKTTTREDMLIARNSLKNRRLTAPDLCRDHNSFSSNKISVSTVKNILKKYKLRGCIAAKKPLLSKTNTKKRYAFGKKFRHWTTQRWRAVMYSDESSFELFPSKFRIPIRRRSHEKFYSQCLQPTVKHSGGTVMVWGCISYYGMGNLVVLEGRVNKDMYLKVIQENIVPSANAMNFPNGKFIYQEDNAPVHSAKVVQEWIRNQTFPRLPWPAQSPDLSPIETVWNCIKMKLRCYKPANRKELIEQITHEWNAFPIGKLQTLCDTMPRRISDVCKAKGGHTKW